MTYTKDYERCRPTRVYGTPANAYPRHMVDEARELRADGWSTKAIAKHLGVGESTASTWTKDVERRKKAPLGEDKINQLLRAWR